MVLNQRLGQLFVGVLLGCLMLIVAACGADATATPTPPEEATATPTPTEPGTETTPTPTSEDATPTPTEEPAATGLMAEIEERGFIRIGFANEPPYGYADATGEVTGEAPEVAKEVLQRMGITEVDGVVVPFGSLIPGLQARRFDMIAAGMFITPDRCDQILFSDPDYAIPQALGVRAGNPHNLMNFDDVAANADVTLGVMSGAVEHDYALDAGVPGNQLDIFDDAANMAEALQAGRIDAFALTSLSVRSQLERLNDPNLETTPGFIATLDGEEQIGAGGYGFHPDHQDFRDAFNEVLNDMKQNDEIVPITEPFGFGEDEINAAKDVTAEDLCAR